MKWWWTAAKSESGRGLNEIKMCLINESAHTCIAICHKVDWYHLAYNYLKLNRKKKSVQKSYRKLSNNSK